MTKRRFYRLLPACCLICIRKRPIFLSEVAAGLAIVDNAFSLTSDASNFSQLSSILNLTTSTSPMGASRCGRAP